MNAFFNDLGIKGEDVIVSINNIDYNLDNIYEMITSSESWKDGEAITIKIKRNGELLTIKGKAKIPLHDSETFRATNDKNKLRNAWLKN